METLSKERISKIKHNINSNNNKDRKKYGIRGTFTYEDFVEKIKQQNGKCYVCNQEFQYNGGKWCCFFPSPDRIYNYTPHTKDNVAISCTFCNIRMFKGINEKKCGLCDGLNHIYTGDIITKSELFRNLGNDNFEIKQYILNLCNGNNTQQQPLKPSRDISITTWLK